MIHYHIHTPLTKYKKQLHFKGVSLLSDESLVDSFSCNSATVKYIYFLLMVMILKKVKWCLKVCGASIPLKYILKCDEMFMQVL